VRAIPGCEGWFQICRKEHNVMCVSRFRRCGSKLKVATRNANFVDVETVEIYIVYRDCKIPLQKNYIINDHPIAIHLFLSFFPSRTLDSISIVAWKTC
jgi:hypothetical protein